MAFNPFHSFRKYNKVVFAGLTILCMVVFVLSSGMGRGDIFNQATDWFTGRGGRTAVVSMYGKNYTQQDILEVRNQRSMANDYMDAAVGAAIRNLEMRLKDSLGRLDTDSRSMFNIAVQSPSIIPLIAQRADNEKKTDLVHALGALAKLSEMEQMLSRRRPGEKFFGLNERDKIDDDADFLIWRHQADQMGVRLNDDHIDQLIASETRGELTKDDYAAISQYMRTNYGAKGYSVESLRAALGDELRVRIAQQALTGTAAGSGLHTLTAPPTELTPQESWNLFKDARTSVKVGMIDVPVKDFLDKVLDKPTDDELKKLFEKYKNDEAAPDRDQPGFKESRKIQVDWIGAATDLPYYQKVADQVLAVAPALRLLGNTLPASALIAPLQLDAELLEQEKTFRNQEPSWTDPLRQIHQSSVLRPENIAALVGSTAAAIGTAAGGIATEAPSVASGLLSMQTRVITQEAKDRAIVGLGMIGLGIAPDAVVQVFGAPVAAMPRVALEKIRKQLIESYKSSLITGAPASQLDRSGVAQFGLIASDLYAFRGEVMKLGREKGKAEVEKYVADFVKQRGLEHGQTSEPRDKFHLSDDPGLSPLKQAYQKVYGPRDLLLQSFGPEFFRDHSQEAIGPDGNFIPHKFVLTGQPDEKQVYWWRTEDLPPKTPKFDKAKNEVAEAWKRIQARDLAKKEADRIFEEISKTPRAVANLKDAAEKAGKLDYFELGPMAPYMPQDVPSQSREAPTRRYYTLQQANSPQAIAQLYGIPATSIAYPDAEMVEKLLNLRKNPAGESTIVTDKPKQNYYVATLLQRNEPDQDEFRRVYRSSMAGAVESGSLLADLALGRPDEYRKAVMDQLRSEAKVVIHESARQRPTE